MSALLSTWTMEMMEESQTSEMIRCLSVLPENILYTDFNDI